MTVSLAILTIIAAVVISSHASFSNSILITNAAYDVALSFRSAESYGIGSRGYGAVVNTGYGLDFSATPNTYLFFADTMPANASTAPDAKPGDGVYTAGQDALISTYRIGGGITINNFCGQAGAKWTCAGTQGSGFTQMDITFTRPNASPVITGQINNSTFKFSAACLSLEAPTGASYRYVSISVNGLISASAASCP